MSVLAQTSMTLGVLDADQDGEGSSARQLIKRSLPYFWRVLGSMLLFQAGMMLIIFIIQAVMVLSAIVTFGLGMICAMPLMFLMYPVIYGATVWMEQTLNGIIIDNMTVMDAAKQGWNLVRNNLLPVALMALVIYFGVGLITGVVMVPLMIPFFIVPIGFLENEPNWIILSISILAIVVAIPLFAILTGWAMIFSKSAWVLTYMRLTRSSKLEPLLQQARA